MRSPRTRTPIFAAVAALVTAKLKILELLVGLARKQLAIVEKGEISDLVKLLAAKQTVLSQLQTLERQLDPFRPQDPETRRWNSADTKNLDAAPAPNRSL